LIHTVTPHFKAGANTEPAGQKEKGMASGEVVEKLKIKNFTHMQEGTAALICYVSSQKSQVPIFGGQRQTSMLTCNSL